MKSAKIVKVIRKGQWTKAIVVEEPEKPKSYTVLCDVWTFVSKRQAVHFATLASKGPCG